MNDFLKPLPPPNRLEPLEPPPVEAIVGLIMFAVAAVLWGIFS